MEFRPLEQPDVKRLQRLFMESLSDLIRRERFEDADLLDEEVARLNTTIQDSLEDEDVQLYVALKDEVIVGACAMLPPNEIITAHVEVEKNAIEIGCFYVSPHVQRQGVGQFLFENIQRELSAHHVTVCYLDAGFPTSQAYWRQKLGDPLLTLEHYWGPGAPHMIWKQEIKK